jgi:hypothetical protein
MINAVDIHGVSILPGERRKNGEEISNHLVLR